MKIRPRRCLYILIALILSGCASWVRMEQPVRSGFLPLEAGGSLGQTFAASYDGLAGVAVYLRPEGAGQGSIRLHVRKGLLDAQDLVVSEIPLEEVSEPGTYRFRFPPIQRSSGQDFSFQLDVDGEGGIATGKASGNSYLNGAAYQDGSPKDAQLSFRLIYDPSLAVLGLIREAFTWLWLVAAGAFLFIVPGWALLRLTYPGWECLKGPEKLGLSAGISLALYPLLFLWTGIVGLRLGPIYAWGPPLIGLAALVWKKMADDGRRTTDDRRQKTLVNRLSSIDRRPSSVLRPSSIALIVVIILILAVRFWAVRGLDAPLYGDSYQHTLISQLLVDHNGLFDSWQPYANLSSFTYHFGFHTAVAAFHWITRLSTPQAALWTGQILNALAALSLYPLASRIGRSPWAGVFAVLLAGLLSPMPMFYSNWGRFTQLAGQVILAAAVYILLDLLESKPQPGTNWPRYFLACLVLGGLALTHYRVLIFAVLFMAAYLILSITSGRLQDLIRKTFWVGAGAGLLFLPWFIHVFAGRIMRIFAVKVSTPAVPASGAAAQLGALGDPLASLPAWMWLLLPLAIGWGLWRREKGAALVSLWWFINLVAANPQWLGLPGAGTIDGYTLMIATYFPASVILGASAGWLILIIEQRAAPAAYGTISGGDRQRGWLALAGGTTGIRIRRASLAVVLLLGILGLGLWGAREQINDLHPAEFALVTRPDMRAAGWIQENIPNQARFLVNAFFAFNDTTVVGSDAGWWLPLLAKRSTTLPPINYAFEVHPQVGSEPLINALTKKIQEKGLEDPEVLDWLKELKVTHIYIGQQQGRVNYTGPYVFDPQKLLKSEHFRLVYHEDRVWIFEIIS